MTKKILFTVMSVVLCLGLIGGAFAYFSDTEESIDNSMSVGIMDLQTFSLGDWSNKAPGGTITYTFSANLTANSTLTPQRLEIDTDYTSVANGATEWAGIFPILPGHLLSGGPSAGWLGFIEVTTFTIGGDDCLTTTTGLTVTTIGTPAVPVADVYIKATDDDDGIGGNEVSLQDISALGIICSSNVPVSSTPVAVSITLVFSTNAGNGFQGDDVDMDFEMAVAQDAAQPVILVDGAN